MSDVDDDRFKSPSPVEKLGRSEHEKKILYCEVCEVPCPTPVHLQEHFKGKSHKEKERALMYGGFKVGELERIIQKVKCLQDYVDETEREPLIGLEYVVEFRHPEMEEPEYECELCESKSKLVPMIVHLNGLKHRKAYINRHFPFTAKTRDPKEDLFMFLRKMALEIERYRGLKMFRVDSPTKNEPGDSLEREPSDSLKRSRRDEDYVSDFEPKRRRNEVFQEEMEKFFGTERVAEVLSRIKPLNKAGSNRDDGPLAPRGTSETGDRWDRENGRSYREQEPESRDMRKSTQKDTSRWGVEEWKKFFLSASSAEKAAWAEKLWKNQPPRKSAFDSGSRSPTSTMQKKRTPGASADDRTVAKTNVDEDLSRSKHGSSRPRHRGSKESRSRDQSSKAQKKESAEEAKKRLEAQRIAEVERRAEAERRVEAEKKAQAERVARAKSVAEALTRIAGEKAKTTPVEPVRDPAVSGKVDEEKLAQAKRVAEAITQAKPNLNKSGIGSFIGKLKSFQDKTVRKPTGDPAVKQAIAEKLAQANRAAQGNAGGIYFEGLRPMPQDTSLGGMPLQNQWNPLAHEAEINRGLQMDALKKPLPWRQAQTVSAPVTTQTVSAPVTAACIPEESVVDLLENFLKQSLGQDDQNNFNEGSGNWNQDSLMQNQPPQYVTASGTWNLVPIAQKQQIQQAIGRGNWNAESYVLQNEPVHRASNPQFYDPPASSFGRSSLNPLNYETKENTSSLFGTQANNSDLRQLAHSDSRGPGSRVFINEYSQADSMSYPSIRGGGPSYSSGQHGTDYQNSSLYRNNHPGPGANRMSANDWQQESASINMRDLPNQGANFNSTSIFASSQGYPASSSPNYSGGSKNKSQENADRALRSSGDPYRDGLKEMAQNRAMAQIRDMSQTRMAERNVCGLTPEILNMIRGKDVFAAWAILSKLSPYHPALKNVNISTLVNQLVEMGIII